MNLFVNGAPANVDAHHLEAALQQLGHAQRHVATAVNGIFIPAHERARFELHEGDRVEILAPMQGG